MSEIKGQLLGMLMVMVIFGAVAGVLYTTFRNTTQTIQQKASNEVALIQD